MSDSGVKVHRYESRVGGVPVNAYLVETDEGVVAIDATLTRSGGRGLREAAQELGKPLVGALVTHSHPDHYGGLVELVGGDEIPIIATAGVNEVIRRDDKIKEGILRPMLGAEWPSARTFPSETVEDGASVELGGARVTVTDLGPGESPHDSMWALDAANAVFAGDQAYNHMHGYLADGHFENWLRHVDRLRGELGSDVTLHVGHGEPATPELLDWQRSYIETFVAAVREADWSNAERARAGVVERMKALLPADELQLLMELSIEPMAQRLGVVPAQGD